MNKPPPVHRHDLRPDGTMKPNDLDGEWVTYKDFAERAAFMQNHINSLTQALRAEQEHADRLLARLHRYEDKEPSP